MKTITITWKTNDVIACAQDQMGIKLTEDQADEVMVILEDGMDANVGICWDTIEYAIEDYLESRS